MPVLSGYILYLVTVFHLPLGLGLAINEGKKEAQIPSLRSVQQLLNHALFPILILLSLQQIKVI